MDKNVVRITEEDLKNIVNESVNKILNENYDGNYAELIKKNMHNLYDLESKVPHTYRAEIHSMVITLQSMYQEIQRKNEIANI